MDTNTKKYNLGQGFNEEYTAGMAQSIEPAAQDFLMNIMEKAKVSRPASRDATMVMTEVAKSKQPAILGYNWMMLQTSVNVGQG